MLYSIQFTSRASKDFIALPQSIQLRFEEKIEGLSKNPKPQGVQKLKGEEHLYRIRVGDYRLVYKIRDSILLILILKIGHRKEIYR